MAAKYRQGMTLMIDYVGAGLKAGDVVDIKGSGLYGVCHSDFEDLKSGAVSIPNGNAVYEVDKESTADEFNIGDPVGISSGSEAVIGSGFGTCIKDSTVTDSTVWVVLSGAASPVNTGP